MARKDSEEVAKYICHVYKNTFNLDRKKTVKHFVCAGKHRNTIYHILDRYDESSSASYKKLSGRPVTVATNKVVKAIENLHITHPNISTRAAARKFGISQSKLCVIKAKRLGFKVGKAIDAPKYNDRQKKIAKTNCRKLVEKRLPSDPSKILVIDDETYCVVDPESINGVKFYSYRCKNKIDPKFKFKSKEKFPKKYLIWLAFDENGAISKPLIVSKTLNSQIYLKECIRKRLIPFIEKKKHFILAGPGYMSLRQNCYVVPG